MLKTFGRCMVVAAALLSAAPGGAAEDAPGAQMTLHADRPGPVIDRRIFGQFAEHLGTGIYGGVWVGPDSRIPNVRGIRKDVVAALRNLQVPVVRWPGGCFADEYHWREGIGPRNKRPVKVNTHWGGVTEPNSFGTHEFMDFAEQIGADAYISGNVGSGSPQEMAEWVEYITAPAGSLADERARNGRKAPWKLPYFGIGNELWGCGGNMLIDYAADVTRRYATFIKVPAGTRTMKLASGATANDSAEKNLVWTEGMMRKAGDVIDGFGLHYYTFPDGMRNKQSATEFDEASWARTIGTALKIDDYLKQHIAIMDKYDPARRVELAVDEWGTWFAPTPGSNPGFLQQQNTMRDAVVAAVTLDVFTKYGDRVKMANIAQMVNVLQAMILTDGPKMVLTPTYHVFEMYKPFQDATRLALDVKSSWYAKDGWSIPAVSATAARAKDGMIYVALTNVDPNQPAPVTVSLAGATATTVTGRVLTAPTMQSYNDFDRPQQVAPAPFTGATVANGTLTATLPPHSVVVLSLR
ncbi:alpha-N-arabinofuranosidase [Sphingomonas quercus]|uniref:Alpha-N-arabinofuranosidase n=1 Tax=Sphingomonas quercus TaxID=2842451 RepID=A0ABS6BIW6_9SPHN|nr:alpha-L-arabinofuranosidase C-terminal domain-containing protein [Sphingomonas quercus]MBU3077376.1 alpha-N-arabinofuranosidase [Sphingomonas quercus]